MATAPFRPDHAVRLNVSFAALGPGILGQTGSSGAVIPYASVRDAMVFDATTDDDFTAVANLPAGDTIPFFTNTLGTAADGSSIAFDPGDSIFGGDT